MCFCMFLGSRSYSFVERPLDVFFLILSLKMRLLSSFSAGLDEAP